MKMKMTTPGSPGKRWNDWRQDQRERAQQALAAMGLNAPPKCDKSYNFPNDFGNNGGT